MSTDTFLTIINPSKGIFRDRGSKFIALAYPVTSTEQVKEILEKLRKEYHDARHHCYAYRLGAAKDIYRVNDDGEPTGSAGLPILGQIRSFDLSNILIVVIRYFGGTLLGVGGLINAYRSACTDALSKAQIIEDVDTVSCRIQYPYSLTSQVMKIIDEENLKIVNQDFTEICFTQLLLPRSQEERIRRKFLKLPGVNLPPHPRNR